MWPDPQDPEESPDKGTPEAEALLNAMHAHAEERAAGWFVDMEFYLWSACAGDGRWQVAEWVPDELAHRLRSLAQDAGGWWIHGGPEGRTFLPLDLWRRRYSKRNTQKETRAVEKITVLKSLMRHTGAGLMICKRALDACLWHEDLAATWVETRGNAVAYSNPEDSPFRRAEAEARRRGRALPDEV